MPGAFVKASLLQAYLGDAAAKPAITICSKGSKSSGTCNQHFQFMHDFLSDRVTFYTFSHPSDQGDNQDQAVSEARDLHHIVNKPH